MLVFTLAPKECFFITVPPSQEETIVRVEIVEIRKAKGKYVKIGTSAPSRVIVDRETVRLKKLEELSAKKTEDEKQ